MARERKVLREFVEALEANNWLEIRRLAVRYNYEMAELFEWVEYAGAHVYAKGTEPYRSAEWKALVQVMESLGSEYLAEAITARHRKESRA